MFKRILNYLCTGIYINYCFTYTKRKDLSIFISHILKSIFFEVEVQHNIDLVYRPNSAPRADIDMFMSKIIEIQDKISNENKIAYLMGDYNMHLLNFVTHKTILTS